jgi:hypothetical protein
MYYHYLSKNNAHIITNRLSEVLSTCKLVDYDEWESGLEGNVIGGIKQFKYQLNYGNVDSSFWVSIYKDGTISFNARVPTGQLLTSYNIKEIALEEHLTMTFRDIILNNLIESSDQDVIV